MRIPSFRLPLALGASLLVALSVPEVAAAQVASSGSGGGSSFGRISGGGGSYGHLTRGFTARRPSPRIPINPRTMANGTANTLRQGRTELVPINPLTMADGTANELRRPPKEERPRPRRGRFVVDGRPYYHYVLPRRAGAAPYDRADAETAEPTRRRRLGRAPSEIPGEAGTGGRLSRAAEGGESEIAPRVRPPIPAEEAGTDAALPPDECAEVRITTSGGIQWRQRVALQSYGASSPDEVAVRLQKIIARGDPVTLNGPDGSFTVRASLVQNLIVGPCRGP